MNPENNRPLLIAILIIGIIILIVLISPKISRNTYSYSGNTFTASALPLTMNTSSSQVGTYSFVRYIPRKNTYSSGTSYTYYTYPETTYDYSYQYQDQGGVVFPDGCTLTSPVSTTTGQPCS